MVIEYLRDYYTALSEEKIALENKYKDIRFCINEKMDQVNILEKEFEKKMIGFMPGADDELEKKKILLMKEEISSFEKKSVSTSIEIQKIEDKLIAIKKELEILAKKDKDFTKNEINADFKLELLKTQEEERQRIARDLHDTTVQTLASMIHRIELCTKLIEIDPVRCKLELLSMNQTIRSSISDLRKVIYDLRPMSFDDIGIDITIQRMLENIKHNCKRQIDISFDLKGECSKISNVQGLTLLRVIEEACNNSIKHAESSRIEVKFYVDEKEIYVSVCDDGCGFDSSDSINKSKNFGLSIMQERIYLLSGTMSVTSELDQGTNIEIRIPLSQSVE